MTDASERASHTPTCVPPMTGPPFRDECEVVETNEQSVQPYGNITAPQGRGTLKRGL